MICNVVQCASGNRDIVTGQYAAVAVGDIASASIDGDIVGSNDL